MCDRTVQWILRHDRRQEFRFAPLGSPAALRLLGARAQGLPDSVVLLDGGGLYTESEAVLRIAARLGRLGLLRAAAALVPRAVRDAMYRLVARNRLRFSGRLEQCRIPSPEQRSQFLND
jgi:predicted DCC family thiol-disulfide oxidoreductase YuxK